MTVQICILQNSKKIAADGLLHQMEKHEECFWKKGTQNASNVDRQKNSISKLISKKKTKLYWMTGKTIHWYVPTSRYN